MEPWKLLVNTISQDANDGYVLFLRYRFVIFIFI